MKSQSFVFVFACFILTATLLVQIGNPIPRGNVRSQTPSAAADAARMRVLESFGRLPLSFEANRGQADPDVKFLSRGNGYRIFLTSTEAVLSLKPSRPSTPLRAVSLSNGDRKGAVHADPSQPLPLGRGSDRTSEDRAVLRMKLAGANPAPRISPLGELPGKINYFIGNDPKQWNKDVPAYAKVKYAEVYPGIDLVYYGNQRQLEYDLVVAPGADPQAIRLDIEGADKLELNAQGDLMLHVSGEESLLKKPFIYQEEQGARREIAGAYVLQGDHRVGFQVASYDAGKPLIIDPVLIYDILLGANGVDKAMAIVVDSAGDAIVTGQTNSGGFPTVNPVIPFNFQNVQMAFVTKFNPKGDTLLYSTYLGGTSTDSSGQGITIDSSGNAYITGWTQSGDFPVRGDAFQNSLQSFTAGFVTKLSASGNLVYSTYLGSVGVSDISQGLAIAVDSSGRAYVTGYTNSSSFPTVSALQSFPGGGLDVFVTKLNDSGTGAIYSTFLGGFGDDQGFGISVDSAGNAYVTGGTSSGNFPTVSGGLQAFYAGGEDAFVSKLNPAGSALVYSTFLGGAGQEEGHGIAVDSSGNAFVTGMSGSSNFPVSNTAAIKPFQASNRGALDAFVTKLNSQGTGVVYSTYLGGFNTDVGQGIAIDASGNAFVTGYSNSPDFPVVNQTTPSKNGGSDAFVTMLNVDGQTLMYSNIIGGSGTEVSNGIGLDSSGNAYVAGYSDSTDAPLTPGGLRFGGLNTDAFIAKFGPQELPFPTLTSLSPASVNAGGAAFTLTVNGTNFVTASSVRWNGNSRPTTFVSSTQLTAAIPASDIANAGSGQVSVLNPVSSTSNVLTLAINAVIVPNPVPVLNTISPLSAPSGGAGFTLTLIGSGFVSGSVVRWNGTSRTTAFVSSSQLTASIPSSDIATVGTAQVAVFNPTPAGGSSGALIFTISGPVVNQSGVLNAASFAASAVAPGEIATAFGNGLLPTPSSKIEVRMNGINALVFNFNNTQVSFQVPWELAGQTQATLTVTVDGAASSPVTVSIAPYNPGIFTLSSTGSGQAAVLIATTNEIAAPSGSVAGAQARPVNRGEFIVIYATGLGPVTNQPASGARAPGNPPFSATTTVPVVTIGGATVAAADVFFSGLAPGFVGLYQINVPVPATASTGNVVPLSLTIGGVTSNLVSIAVQ